MTKLSSFGLLILTLAALYFLQHSTPYYSDILSPVAVAGMQGSAVKADRFALGVGNAYRARQLTTPGVSRERSYSTQGEWLVIEAAAKAEIESLSLMSVAWLGPNGVRYRLTGRLSSVAGMIGSERLEPGIVRPVLIVFELPADQIKGGRLLIAESALTPLSEELHITLDDDRLHDVHRSIEIARGDSVMAWQLEMTE
ncbi:hypothetical protein A8A54_18555 [Brucella pseudogrignonensis]|uniref:Uncharacterized protein n=2 Tax=Brucella TaxID=234 RepID=A0A656Z748_BRUAN|nr:MULTISPECIES: hypothetical protein [Brucella]ANG98628.1 hypothetical protein A8A54_18555 [Brucella pseudogrignonensis]KYB45076.1 hypothetical protein AB664_00215 [Brucella anthropi]OYR23899.1 hypothetical protein CEV34_3232 [Brucella pseudogrignonensis]